MQRKRELPMCTSRQNHTNNSQLMKYKEVLINIGVGTGDAKK